MVLKLSKEKTKMKDLKMINKNLNTMHDALEGLRDEINSIEGKASRSACIVAFNEIVRLFSFLDGMLS